MIMVTIRGWRNIEDVTDRVYLLTGSNATGHTRISLWQEVTEHRFELSAYRMRVSHSIATPKSWPVQEVIITVVWVVTAVYEYSGTGTELYTLQKFVRKHIEVCSVVPCPLSASTPGKSRHQIMMMTLCRTSHYYSASDSLHSEYFTFYTSVIIIIHKFSNND
jgi:hypothetical protein